MGTRRPSYTYNRHPDPLYANWRRLAVQVLLQAVRDVQFESTRYLRPQRGHIHDKAWTLQWLNTEGRDLALALGFSWPGEITEASLPRLGRSYMEGG